MSNFMKLAYSTSYSAEMRICYDTTSYDFSAVYEHEASYAEFCCECQFEVEGWN